jgi:hypothetical protein
MGQLRWQCVATVSALLTVGFSALLKQAHDEFEGEFSVAAKTALALRSCAYLPKHPPKAAPSFPRGISGDNP